MWLKELLFTRIHDSMASNWIWILFHNECMLICHGFCHQHTDMCENALNYFLHIRNVHGIFRVPFTPNSFDLFGNCNFLVRQSQLKNIQSTEKIKMSVQQGGKIKWKIWYSQNSHLVYSYWHCELQMYCLDSKPHIYCISHCVHHIHRGYRNEMYNTI